MRHLDDALAKDKRPAGAEDVRQNGVPHQSMSIIEMKQVNRWQLKNEAQHVHL